MSMFYCVCVSPQFQLISSLYLRSEYHRVKVRVRVRVLTKDIVEHRHAGLEARWNLDTDPFDTSDCLLPFTHFFSPSSFPTAIFKFSVLN